MLVGLLRASGHKAEQSEPVAEDLFMRVLQLSDNAGSTDADRALNYLSVQELPAWVVGRSGPRPARLVDPGRRGRVTRLLDGPVAGDEPVATTVEWRGGAWAPTTEPVVVVDIEA